MALSIPLLASAANGGEVKRASHLQHPLHQRLTLLTTVSSALTALSSLYRGACGEGKVLRRKWRRVKTVEKLSRSRGWMEGERKVKVLVVPNPLQPRGL